MPEYFKFLRSSHDVITTIDFLTEIDLFSWPLVFSQILGDYH